MRGSGRTNKKQKEDLPEQWYEAMMLYPGLTGTHKQNILRWHIWHTIYF